MAGHFHKCMNEWIYWTLQVSFEEKVVEHFPSVEFSLPFGHVYLKHDRCPHCHRIGCNFVGQERHTAHEGDPTESESTDANNWRPHLYRPNSGNSVSLAGLCVTNKPMPFGRIWPSKNLIQVIKLKKYFFEVQNNKIQLTLRLVRGVWWRRIIWVTKPLCFGFRRRLFQVHVELQSFEVVVKMIWSLLMLRTAERCMTIAFEWIEANKSST